MNKIKDYFDHIQSLINFFRVDCFLEYNFQLWKLSNMSTNKKKDFIYLP